MYIFRRKRLSKNKLKKYKKLVARAKLKFVRKYKGRRKRRRIRGYRLKRLKFFMKLKSPEGNAINLGESYLSKIQRRLRKKVKNKYMSTKVTLNLFKVTYNVLLNYHCPLGKRRGEWRYGVMLTNIFMIRNRMSILDLTNIFFELRKMVNRLFKAVKLRKAVALLNGRRYGWRRLFTFIFEKWLPGFFTNFYLNMNELMGYFIRRRFLTRRQKARALSLKAMCLDKRYLRSFRDDNKSKKKGENQIISFMKLPKVSLSLIDNTVWLRECQKEGITAIQIIDSNSEIEKVNYPIISNQKSIAFLSFITLLAKEISYQARRWELNRLKKPLNGYILNSRMKEADIINSAVGDYFWWQNKIHRYNKLLRHGFNVGKMFPEISREKISDRKFLISNTLENRRKLKKLDGKIKAATTIHSERVAVLSRFLGGV